MYRIIRRFSTGKLNYYEVLEVPKSATQNEIKQAFFKLSKKYHPDVTGANAAATKKFVQVTEAYDTLKDERKRQDYDYSLSGGGAFGGFGKSGGFKGSPFGDREFKQWQNGGFQYTFRQGGRKFTAEDFEKIWREFQKTTQNPQNASYDERMYREARQKVWDDFTRKRDESWQVRAQEHAKRYPFDNMQTNPLFKINWERFNKLMMVYVGAFFLVALFQTVYSSGERKYQKSQAFSDPPQGQTMTPSESLRDLMNKPPTVQPQQPRDGSDDKPW